MTGFKTICIKNQGRLFYNKDILIEGGAGMNLREKAHEIVDKISENKLVEVINFLEFLKIKEEIEATNEILDDKKLLESIEKGLIQYNSGDLVSLDDVVKDV